MSSLIEPAPVAPETVEGVLRALDASPEPLTAKQIGAALTGPSRLKPDDLQKLLGELVEAKRIEKLPPYRGQDRYWTRTLDDYARLRIRQALDRRPLTRSELKASVKAALRGVSEKRQGEILRELEQQGEIQKLPPLIGSRTDRFSTRPADPREYVADALEKLAAKLSKTGIDRASLHTACRELLDGAAGNSRAVSTPAEDRPAPAATVGSDGRSSRAPDDHLARLIIERMQAIEPAAARGALVSIAELRAQPEFRNVNKKTFDRVLLDLGRRERVDLHRHDFPMSVSEEERERFVLDERGRYYNGVSLRLKS